MSSTSPTLAPTPEQDESASHPDFTPLDVTNPPERDSLIAIVENGELVNGRKFLQLKKDGRTVCYRESRGSISYRWAEAVHVPLSTQPGHPSPHSSQGRRQLSRKPGEWPDVLF